MTFWENSNFTYKNFLKFFSSKLFNSEFKTYIYLKNIKFEVKLYLIGLSFNRFLFNIDKLFINLCVISNFLFFLCKYKPTVLFVGNLEYSCFFKFFSYQTFNLSYEYKLLPGSIIGTLEATEFAIRKEREVFNNNFDCIILFFYYPNIQFLKEICRRCIPIIGIIEVDSPKFILECVTYPLFSNETKKNFFFFLTYFNKILFIDRLSKYKIYSFKYKYFFKYFNYYYNFFLYLNSLKYFSNIFVNINKFIRNVKLTTNNTIILYKNPIEFFEYYIFLINFVYSLKKEFSLMKNIQKNLKTFFILFNEKMFKNINILKKTKKIEKKKLKKKNNLRNRKERLQTRGKKKWYDNKKELVIYINKILLLKKLEIYKMEKNSGTIARIIYENSKINPKWQQWLNTKFNNPLKPKKKKFIRRIISKSDYEGPKLSYWEIRKRNVFNISVLPKFKKPKTRLKFGWPLKLLTKRSSFCAPVKYTYYKKPRKILLKKKVFIQKMIYYYYDIYLKNSLKGLVKFSKRSKHNLNYQYSNNFSNILESKLCIFLLRIKFANNIWKSKELITKGNIYVNGLQNYNPGYLLRINDIIQFKINSLIEYKTKFFKIFKPKRLWRVKYFWKLSKYKGHGNLIKNSILGEVIFKLQKKVNLFFLTFFKKKRIKMKIKKRKFFHDVILQGYDDDN